MWVGVSVGRGICRCGYLWVGASVGRGICG